MATLPQILKPERLLFILVSFVLCVLPFWIYFGVFYQLPTAVRLHLENWTSLSFRFFGSSFPYSGVVDAPVVIDSETVVSLDLFWLRDESLEDSANLPDPHVLAGEIAEDLRSALEQIESIMGDLQARAALP